MKTAIVKAFPQKRHVYPGDTFNLLVNDKLVCTKRITNMQILSYFAYVQSQFYCGFLVGSDDLQEGLVSEGYTIVPEETYAG